MRASRLAAFLAILAVFTACAHYPLNAPLQAYAPAGGYRFDNLETGAGNTDTTLLCLTFSGGGTRAAAFAYGALQELRDTLITVAGEQRPILDEVDCISSVSGGSFTAAYYALFRERLFRDFEARFLRRNVQGELIALGVDPANLVRLLSPNFSRIDLAAELYDSTVFDGKRYADLLGKPRPFLILNGTNVALGSRFEFTQEQFDFLGSDLGQYPIARAVAASSAFPVLLNPLSLKNLPEPPNFTVPLKVRNALKDNVTNPREYLWAKHLVTYRDKSGHPYLHLIDGGLSDNIGLRAVTDAYLHGFIGRRINDGAVQNLIVVAVNAKTDPPEATDRLESPPGVSSVIMKAMNVSMQNYSFETVDFMRNLVENRSQAQRDIAACQQILDARCPGTHLDHFPATLRLHVIEINFDQFADPAQRDFFLGLPTTFALSNGEIDCLIAAGRKLLRDSDEYRQMLQELGGTLRPGVESAAELPGCKASN
jgi:NTE family protein